MTSPRAYRLRYSSLADYKAAAAVLGLPQNVEADGEKYCYPVLAAPPAAGKGAPLGATKEHCQVREGRVSYSNANRLYILCGSCVL